MNCPQCQTPLNPVLSKNGNVVIDTCPTCKGFWFDRGELQKALPEAATKVPIPPDAVETDRDCPRCRANMLTVTYPGTLVKINICPACSGVWLNQDQIREIQVVRKARQQGLAEASEDTPDRSPGSGYLGSEEGSLLDIAFTVLRFLSWW